MAYVILETQVQAYLHPQLASIVQEDGLAPSHRQGVLHKCCSYNHKGGSDYPDIYTLPWLWP
jgi:hypothetical protein